MKKQSNNDKQCASYWREVLPHTKGAWLLLLVLAVIARLLLPGGHSDTTMVHLKLVESLMAGHNWGRQALVGTYDYPLLPTLSLLMAQVVGKSVGLSGPRLLTAIAQVWTLSYIMRFPKTYRAKCCVVPVLGLGLLFPEFREAIWVWDPNWVTVIVAASAIFHAERWLCEGLLRDAIVGAVTCGVLAFSGAISMLFAVTTLSAMCAVPWRQLSSEKGNGEGVSLLIWTPFAYCIFLLFLWNWFILGNAFFGLRNLWYWFASSGGGETVIRLGHELGAMPRPLLAGAGILLVCWGVTRFRFPAYLLLGTMTALWCSALLRAVGAYAAGGTLLGCLLLIVACLWIVSNVLSGRISARKVAYPALFIISVCICLAWRIPGTSLVEEAAFASGAPEATEITRYIDRFWPESRVMLYGVRVPALYHDPLEKRFVASLDYHEGIFLRKALEEQLHLLMPPANSGFASIRGLPFSAVRNRLLLEKQWATGWQLWRCVIPPEGESRLKGLQ